jgi:hypothetical protein
MAGALPRYGTWVMLSPLAEQHAGELHRGAGAGRTVFHRRLVGLGVGHEPLETVGGKIRTRQQRDRLLGDQRDRREVGRGIVERALVE